jgi:hypothetical protein
VRWTLVPLAHSALYGLMESVDDGLEEEAPSVGQRSISLYLVMTVRIWRSLPVLRLPLLPRARTDRSWLCAIARAPPIGGAGPARPIGRCWADPAIAVVRNAMKVITKPQQSLLAPTSLLLEYASFCWPCTLPPFSEAAPPQVQPADSPTTILAHPALSKGADALGLVEISELPRPRFGSVAASRSLPSSLEEGGSDRASANGSGSASSSENRE